MRPATEFRPARATGGRLVLATVLLFGAATVAACGGDDGATVRNLNQEEPVPDCGSASGSEGESTSAPDGSRGPSDSTTGSCQETE
jgi:hypothetical protein